MLRTDTLPIKCGLVAFNSLAVLRGLRLTCLFSTVPVLLDMSLGLPVFGLGTGVRVSSESLNFLMKRCTERLEAV